jgi:pimeloyl-ACP methyl ester carboxylesterase
LPIELAVSLAKNQEFIAFDNRGQGLSIEYNTTEPLTIQGMANDTMELINALNLTRPTVFGYSMGGMIATDLVAEYGPSLGLVIVASGSAGGPQSMPPTEEATAVLINPNATERDSLSLSFNLNNAHSRKAACNNYIASFYDVNSPQNGTTTRRQLGAVARWVSHKLH